MTDPFIAPDPDGVPAPLVARWVFRAALTALIFFLIFGLFDGFDHGLWWKALTAGAVYSALTHAEQEWRARQARRRDRPL